MEFKKILRSQKTREIVAKISSKRWGGSLTLNLKHLTIAFTSDNQPTKKTPWMSTETMTSGCCHGPNHSTEMLQTVGHVLWRVLPEEAHQLSSYPFVPISVDPQTWLITLIRGIPWQAMPFQWRDNSQRVALWPVALRQLWSPPAKRGHGVIGCCWTGSAGHSLTANMQNSGKRRIHCADRIEPSNC